MTEPEPRLVELGARVHLFVKPRARDAFTELFREVLGCRTVELDFGLEHPILLVSFENGSAFSVEFTELAPEPSERADVDDEHAFRGAWIEFRTTDLDGQAARLRRAGIPEFRHPGSSHVYFSAPGGQVFRLLALDYRGP
jgi:hypothetical protein